MTFLRDERIGAVSKTVEVILKDGVFPVVASIDRTLFLPAIEDIRDRIESGRPLDRYYRRSTGEDVLLRDDGIMHLHVDPTGDDDVLLLVGQTDDTVLFIALVRHDDVFKPPAYAKGLRRWLGRSLADWWLARSRQARR